MIIEKIRHASMCVVGKNHIKSNVECQDRTYYIKKNGVHVLSLSDGAGSREKSQFGAEIVTKSICEYVSANFIELLVLSEKRGKDSDEINKDMNKLKSKIIEHIHKDLNDFVYKNNNISLNDLACTLMFVAVRNNQYLLGHIGDGVIGALTSEMGNETLRVLSHPENGGAPNITYFITDENAVDHLRILSGEIPNLKGLILMSDGPEEALYSKTDGLNDNTFILFEGFKSSLTNDYEDFLKMILENKISEISYDDLSLNILYHDVINTKTLNDDNLIKELLDRISVEQIIPLSKYSVLIDESINCKTEVKSWDYIYNDYLRRYK